VALLASVEADRGQRNIAGTATATGLHETYRSTRLLAGAARKWQPAAGRLTAEASLFRSTPEHQRVAFSGRFGPAGIDGARAGTMAGTAHALRSCKDPAQRQRSVDGGLAIAGHERAAGAHAASPDVRGHGNVLNPPPFVRSAVRPDIVGELR
jgi:hypothetical protein